MLATGEGNEATEDDARRGYKNPNHRLAHPNNGQVVHDDAEPEDAPRDFLALSPQLLRLRLFAVRDQLFYLLNREIKEDPCDRPEEVARRHGSSAVVIFAILGFDIVVGVAGLVPHSCVIIVAELAFVRVKNTVGLSVALP